MWTHHSIITGKLIFLLTEKTTKTHRKIYLDILAIYINVTNMADAFIIDLFCRNYSKKKKWQTKYFAFADKWQIQSC